MPAVAATPPQARPSRSATTIVLTPLATAMAAFMSAAATTIAVIGRRVG
jgi:hypothetical protein